MTLTKRTIMFAGAAAAAAALTAGALVTSASAAVKSGAQAPAFTALDSNGKTVRLADFAGKTVVLEWTNDGCPYVQKHYNAGAMQKLQREATGEGVVWLSVISSAPGAQGYADGARANALTKDRNAAPTAVLLDPDGALGKMYDARTTPHMYVINGSGALVYQGAIDDKASSDPATLSGARNYVKEALTAAKAGRAPAVTATKPYGCSVKYR